MTDDTTPPSEDDKKLSVTASDLNRVIPKLATKVLLGKAGTNTLLTFVMDMGNGSAQVIETIVIDNNLHKGLIKLLQENIDQEGVKK
jgi:hypothetical protein